MKKKFGRVVLAGAIALGGLGVANVVSPAIQAQAATGYESPGFFETAVYDATANTWTYVATGETVTLAGEGTLQMGMETGYIGYHDIKHYVDGVLVSEGLAYKDPDHMGEIVYLDITAKGKHEIVFAPQDNPSDTDTFVLNVK